MVNIFYNRYGKSNLTVKTKIKRCKLIYKGLTI